ncbi:hypothetical protein [Streptomyces sp. NPDC048295]
MTRIHFADRAAARSALLPYPRYAWVVRLKEAMRAAAAVSCG